MEYHNYVIRKIRPEDASAWLSLLSQLMEESEYMLYTKHDRDFNIERCKSHINNMIISDQSEILLVEADTNKIVGYLLGEIEKMYRKSHVMTLCGGILRSHQRGFSRKLVEEITLLAKKKGIIKIEFSVLESNKICINASKRMGFKIEGLKIQAVKTSNGYENEYLMGILI